MFDTCLSNVKNYCNMMSFNINYSPEGSESIPQEIEEAATRATLDLLPTKSKKQYELAYKRFVEWCDRNNVAGKYSENVMLAYFEQNSKIWKSSTLWAHFSMIKAMLNVNNNQDISKFYKLIAFLKRKGEGYRPKKSKIFTRQNIDKFIAEAPDDKYLMFKVVAVMGILGACRREELCQMSLNNIEDLGNTLVVNIPDSKTRVSRTFTVITETYIDLYHKYLALRPAHVNHQRLFIKYTSNKCTIQPVGINIFGKMPTDIARFLKLPNSELYTGHCFRRTSASLLADSGANLCTIKRHGGWKSSSVAEGYLEDSLENKKRIACHILPNNCPSSNNSEIEHINSISSTASSSTSTISSCEVASSQGINITNCSNCTININISK